MFTQRKIDIEVEKKKIQIDLISKCIEQSRQIIIANAAKQSLRNAEFFINRFRAVLPSERFIKELNQELEYRIFELKRNISISLNHLITDKEILIEDLFWFSPSDLKYGYVLLYRNSYTTIPSSVLFLVETRDVFDGKIYFPGDVKPFRQVNHTLTSVKGLTEKELGIGFTYATKAEILNELSTLSSILKSKNNGRNRNIKTE